MLMSFFLQKFSGNNEIFYELQKILNDNEMKLTYFRDDIIIDFKQRKKYQDFTLEIYVKKNGKNQISKNDNNMKTHFTVEIDV